MDLRERRARPQRRSDSVRASRRQVRRQLVWQTGQPWPLDALQRLVAMAALAPVGPAAQHYQLLAQTLSGCSLDTIDCAAWQATQGKALLELRGAEREMAVQAGAVALEEQMPAPGLTRSMRAAKSPAEEPAQGAAAGCSTVGADDIGRSAAAAGAAGAAGDVGGSCAAADPAAGPSGGAAARAAGPVVVPATTPALPEVGGEPPMRERRACPQRRSGSMRASRRQVDMRERRACPRRSSGGTRASRRQVDMRERRARPRRRSGSGTRASRRQVDMRERRARPRWRSGSMRALLPLPVTRGRRPWTASSARQQEACPPPSQGLPTCRPSPPAADTPPEDAWKGPWRHALRNAPGAPFVKPQSSFCRLGGFAWVGCFAAAALTSMGGDCGDDVSGQVGSSSRGGGRTGRRRGAPREDPTLRAALTRPSTSGQ